MGNSKPRDSSFKLIFDEPELFIEFLQNFIKIDLFDDLQPSDIEDVTERYIPLFQDEKASDTVKRINLKGNTPLFVIAILEHESKVNYRASFKMLQYIALVLNDYEKEANKLKEKASFEKEFKYPPVLPIVFYDGTDRWTAEMNFLHKTELHDVFGKYIPKFEYELISLNQYSEQDLAQFGDTLSLIMIIDKIRTADGMSMLGKLPADYVEKLALNIPAHLNKLIADVITILLKKINVPEDEIEEVTERIYQRRYQEMFTFIEDYDVQETRRIAAAEAYEEAAIEAEEKSIQSIKNMLLDGQPPESISRWLKIPIDKIAKIKESLGRV